jgi:aspartate-semialdehyde dehydrogenase
MKVAIIGATGLVGKKISEILLERKFPVEKLLRVASENSINKEMGIIGIEDAIKEKPDIVFFSAGNEVSKEWAPKFQEVNSVVIDNSSAFRMDEDIKLIVPEINGNLLNKEDKIIANPNCSTIQMVMALYPLHKKYKIKRIIVSTYQSVTGTGRKAIKQLEDERKGGKGEKVYPYNIDLNCFPYSGNLLENGYSAEEMKLVNETKKILKDGSIQITATVVRVPVLGGHSESINVEFENEFKLADVVSELSNFNGVTVGDCPTPLEAQNKNEVFVGRIRRDESQPKTLNLWVVSDNLRKGASLNAVQIAECLI